MKTFLAPAAILTLPVLLCLLPACGDDDPAAPAATETFQVVVEVADEQGDPVPDVVVALIPDVPAYLLPYAPMGDDVPLPGNPGLDCPFPNPFNRSVSLTYLLTAAGRVALAIEDIEGTVIRVLVAEDKPAGLFAAWWNGRDGEGTPQNSGVYAAHLVVRDPDTGELQLDERKYMLKAEMDPEDFPVGVTGQDGRFVLTDKRLFPFLYEPVDMIVTDENGTQIETLTLTAAVRFFLNDYGCTRVEDVPGSGTTVRLVLCAPTE